MENHALPHSSLQNFAVSPAPVDASAPATRVDLHGGPGQAKRVATEPLHRFVLGTTWAPPRHPIVEDLPGCLACWQDLGAQALALVGAGVWQVPCDALVTHLLACSDRLPVLVVDGMLGALRLGRPFSARARACSPDRREADEAVAVAKAALALASDLSAKAIVISLGAVAGSGIERLFRRLLGQQARGVLLYEDDLALELRSARAALAVDHMDASLRSLDRIVEAAARQGTEILLLNSRGLELPLALEFVALAREFGSGPVAPFLDLAAAHWASTLRLVPFSDTVMAFANGPLCSVGDACGPMGGLPPGQGELDLPAICRRLPAHAMRVFLPRPTLSEVEVRAGLTACATL